MHPGGRKGGGYPEGVVRCIMQDHIDAGMPAGIDGRQEFDLTRTRQSKLPLECMR